MKVNVLLVSPVPLALALIWESNACAMGSGTTNETRGAAPEICLM